MQPIIQGSSAHNKAAMILASMSPDMVEDIISLVNQRGRALIADLNIVDGPPRPLAIMSRSFIADEDFPEVFVGMCTVMLGAFRTLKHDAEFYKSTLKDAFSMPDSMAQSMADKIETHDIVGGSDAARESMGWWHKLVINTEEGIRRVANWIPSVLQLPLYNDQDQEYDIDFLYELKNLGVAVNELNSRARLIRGQAAAAYAMGLFKGDKTMYKGLLGGGDPSLDPTTAAELHFMQTAEPLMGDTMPAKMYGGLANFVTKAKEFAAHALAGLASSAGHGDNPSGNDPVMANAIDNIRQGGQGPSSIAKATQSGIPVDDIVNFIMRYQQGGDNQQMGDAYGDVHDSYGQDVADAWHEGDLPGVMTHIARINQEPLATTGDPELDEELVGDVMSETDNADTDPEIGGLFKKARARHQLKKGLRKQRKRLKHQAKQKKKSQTNQDLINARSFSQQQDDLYNSDAAAESADMDAAYNQSEQQYYNQAPNTPVSSEILASAGYNPGGDGYFQGFDFAAPAGASVDPGVSGGVALSTM
jgi:hypothetical protein